MDNKLVYFENEQGWLEFRKKIIGGSDVGAILGFNKYRTALDVYYDKINPTVERINNPKMEAGKRMEQPIADWWMDVTGLECVPDVNENGDQVIRVHQEYDFLGATLDRIILPHFDQILQIDKENGALEIKTTSEYAESYWSEGPPLSYYAQNQHQMSVTGWQYGEFALLRGGWDFKRFIQERDDEFIEMMNRELIHFWQEHVLKQIPPEPRSESEVLRLFPKSMEKKVQANEDVYNSWHELKKIRQQIKELENQDNQIVEQIKILMKDAEILEYNGITLATWKSSNGFNEDRFKLENEPLYDEYQMEVFDKNRFKVENKDLYNEYCEKIGSRKFVVKDNQDK